MRGVESTTTTRIYESDAAKVVSWVSELNKKLSSKRKLTTADLHRHVYSENVRYKKRNAYLEFVVAQLDRQIKQLQEELRKCRRFVGATYA